MKRSFAAIGSTFAAAVCCVNALAAGYNVTLPLTDAQNGLKAVIVDYDTSEKLDSAIVADGKAVFSNSITAPVLARILVDGNRAALIILEDGDITVGADGIGAGTTLNDRLGKFNADQQAKLAEFQALPQDASDEQKQKIIDEYNAISTDALALNGDNPFGYYLLIQEAYEWPDIKTFDQKLSQYPALAGYKRFQTLRQGLLNKEETSVGHPYKDFEITFEGETKRLSDYVGKGKYTLVDFWASWCGPCIRETKVLKELWDKYHDKGLDFLGVAVWDEPENTRRAIEQYKLPWPQILNTQNVATDIYGIPAIPCIILFDPQGNIISRDKQDQELVADVDAAMAAVAK